MRLRHISQTLLLLLLYVTSLPSQSRAPFAGPLPPNTPVIPGNLQGAPFSARVIAEYDRVLDNGNHIHRRTQGRVFRDAQGRVRTENEFAGLTGSDKSQHITIQDPVLRVVIHLDPRTRTAWVRRLGEVTSSIASAQEQPGSSRPGPAILVAPQSQSGTVSPETTTVSPRQSDGTNTPLVRMENLGLKPVDTRPAIGTRTVRTTTNRGGESVVSITETWFSPQLQMVVLSLTDGGQSGHSMMKVLDIVRRAPNPLLFRIPPDYTVKDTNPVTASVVGRQ